MATKFKNLRQKTWFYAIILSNYWGSQTAFSEKSDEKKSSYIFAEEEEPTQTDFSKSNVHRLVEEFTAQTLSEGEFKLGLDFEYGITNKLMASTDLTSAILGIPSMQGRFQVWGNAKHLVALGVRAAFLDLDHVSHWAPVHDYFETLNANIVRPSFAWTNTFSNRLKLHTFWTIGLGKVNATLSEKGRRRIWDAKHPDGNYETRDIGGSEDINNDSDTNISTNLEKKDENSSNITRRTLELQSLFGLSTDKFQVTGEFVRDNGNKILLTTRIERMVLEDLRANSINMSIAQQWISNSFQFKLGIGFQYLAISGTDLDGEKVNEIGTNPIPDISFYWRF